MLLITSGLAAQPGTPNPLANHPYVLLRESLASIMKKTGVQIPAGTSPYKVLGLACGNRSPDCQKIMTAVDSDAASAARADANGKAVLPGVAAGTDQPDDFHAIQQSGAGMGHADPTQER